MYLLMTPYDDPQDTWAAPLTSTARAAHLVPLRKGYLANLIADADRLTEQRWGLLVPEGHAGNGLEAILSPLLELRSEEQGREALVIRVPPKMNWEMAAEWKRTVYPLAYRHRESDRPRYLLIAGDMDQISWPTQQVLTEDSLPGRLVCPTLQDYAAYVDKVCRWAKSGALSESPRTYFYTVNDGTPATHSSYGQLVRPCLQHCTAEDYHAEDRGADRPDPSEFLRLAQEASSAVIFSVSHGLGPPRRRTWTPQEAQAHMGAMSFGPEGHLRARDVLGQPFLPGGIWLYFACFGAGVPSESSYAHWLRWQAHHEPQDLAKVEALLPQLTQYGGFTSGLAQTALAHPEGPLAILGHVDLVWSYGYEGLHIDTSGHVQRHHRARSFSEVCIRLMAGSRVGAAYFQIQQDINQVSRALNHRYDQYQKHRTPSDQQQVSEQRNLGYLWMLRQDLGGYVVLGDPAVRLPIQRPSKPTASVPHFGFGEVRRPASPSRAGHASVACLMHSKKGP